MRPRLYWPAAAANAEFLLDEAQTRHLIKVLRMKKGEALEVFDGRGRGFAAVVRGDDKRAAAVQTGAELPPAAADGGRMVHIGQGLCAGGKMDWAVEKMTELGAAVITPLLCAGGAGGRPNLERWRRLTIAACEQCGRRVLPELRAPVPAEAWQPCERRFLLSPRGAASFREAMAGLAEDEEIALAVGTESGFDAATEARFVENGFVAVNMGPRILRAETAALAALAAALL